MDRRIGLWMTAMAVTAGLAVAPIASAGTYTVYACSTTAGKFTNHSWAIENTSPALFRTGDCAAGDASPRMSLGSDSVKTYAPTDHATLTFRAPDGATIVGFWLHRYMQQFNPVDHYPGRDMVFDLGQLGAVPFELSGHHDASTYSTVGTAWCNHGEACDGEDVVTTATFPALAGYAGGAAYLRYTLGCYPPGGCALDVNGVGDRGSINLNIYGAAVTVNDSTKPVIGRILQSGLAAGGIVSGDEPLAFDASDNSGIKSAQLVDATPGGDEKVIGSRDFACDYSYAAPCPQAVGAEITPSGLPAGTRLLRLQVADAGGNVTATPLFPVVIGGASNGTPADPGAKLTAAFARNRRGTIEVPFGKRASIRGKLVTSAGAPIAGATVWVVDRQLRDGTEYAKRSEVTTGADGSFSVLPSLGPARAIRFEYRSRQLLATPDAATKVELRVQAGATLAISPRRVRPRGTIRISGRLKGLPLPASGKVVELQALEGGKWRPVGTVRARGQGRFSTTYRFLRAGRGASFLIRARVRRDDSYPYYLGYSPRVRVRVR